MFESSVMKSSLSFLLLLCCVRIASAQTSEAVAGKIVPNRAPLQSNAFNPLPLGAVNPEGWLYRQLETQAAGLSGHLDEVWKDVGPTSAWLGGSGESFERGPYFVDGLVPLAYLLHDARLEAKAKHWVDWTLTHQQPNGQFGPSTSDDWWPRMVMLKALTQYAEVSGDARVIPAMQKYFAYELHELPTHPLRDWGKYRWQDNVASVLWLYNRTGDRSLLELAKLLHKQGFDWQREFADFQYTTKKTIEQLGSKPNGPIPDALMQSHGVNVAMSLKTSPVWWLVSGGAADHAALLHELQVIDRYHGFPNGLFSGDEQFAGSNPSEGIELCAVVESMFSLEQSYAILGDPRLADRLERIAYNALPATFSNDMWSHQYFQQPNQIAATPVQRPWTSGGKEGNLFGLSPNFGCCTANLHQGWPKLVSSLWLATNDGGLAVDAYGPSQVRTTLQGVPVAIEEQTDYPFHSKVRFTIRSDKPNTFPLVLRIPEWADRTVITANGETLPSAAAHSLIYRLQRQWKSGDTVEIFFDMQPHVTHWYHDSAVFERGPLVFALPLQGAWSELKKYKENAADWSVTPGAAWNYAVEIGDCSAIAEEHPIGKVPFDEVQPPVTLAISGRRLPEWPSQDGSAGPMPASPAKSMDPMQSMRLIPYGAAKLRITAFPYLREQAKCQGTSSSVGGE